MDPVDTTQTQTTQALFRFIAEGHRSLRVVGLSASSKAWMTTEMFQSSERTILSILPSGDHARQFHQDLMCWTQWVGGSTSNLLNLPDLETLVPKGMVLDNDLIRQFIGTLYRLTLEKPCILTTSATVLRQAIIAKKAFSDLATPLKKGTHMDRDFLLNRWDRLGYRRVDLVEEPGEFCVRGGLMDIYSPGQQDPVRSEWSGDRLESIRLFDPESQLSKEKVDHFVVLPFLPPHDPKGPYALGSLMDYLTGCVIQIWVDPEQDPDKKILEVSQNHHEPISIVMSNVSLGLEGGSRDGTIEIQKTFQTPEALGLGLPGTPLAKNLESIGDLRKKTRILVAAKSQGQQDRILDLFQDHEIPAHRLTSHTPLKIQNRQSPFLPDPIVIVVGDLSGGFYDADSKILVLTDEDLFGKGIRHRPPSRRKLARALFSLEDLNVRDHVVHLQHGIGLYRGIRRLKIRGYETDFLEIQYLGGDLLYVPLDHLNLVQRYKGIEDHPPPLDRLGGMTWARTTGRVKKQVELIAKELVQLYAEREICNAKPYSPDTTLSREFEAAFEFEETPDQLQSIEDVKRDMERARPMDRLVCGDVGYGKTEVAMRAAFKSIMDNRQVAVLVPTTLLAHQHQRTFRRRFSPFAIRVEMLSRFCTRRDIENIRRDLALGKVDIVIGTHRMLQNDIEFKHLGLLIVDEEQRFGVGHKEKIKQLRRSVDVLTLTATPIPRTLQMSLIGLRDLSTIDTPPLDRIAVKTRLVQFNPEIIRSGIERELSRGGQVFFVHNRIEGIERVAQFLSDLVPQIRIGVAHGRMRERALESVMLGFINHRFDVLLSTAIIESGLDIPSANTIFINNAHRFGLADLYQLRGRVGRSNHQAYAYCLVPTEAVLSEESRSRLMALQDFCDLGAGFRIAARDLEIRGAGHLLGKKQSGQIAAVGIEYFLNIIERTVRELKGTPIEESLDPTLDLPVSAFIPEDYISEVHQRLGIYRRLSDIGNGAEIAELTTQLVDRYGPIPDPMVRLLEIVNLRVLARSLGIEMIHYGIKGLDLVFGQNCNLNERQVDFLLGCSNRIQLLSQSSLRMHLDSSEWDVIYGTLNLCLKTLVQYDTSSHQR